MSSEEIKKPKCYLCGKAESDMVYVYHNKKLAHLRCLNGVEKSLDVYKYTEKIVREFLVIFEEKKKLNEEK